MKNIKVAPNQKVIQIHKVHGKGGRIFDITANKQAMAELSTHTYVLYMHFMQSMPGYIEALSMKQLTATTSLSERTYYKAVNELIEKKYLIKEHHKEFKEYYGFYEKPQVLKTTDDHILTVEEYIIKYLTPKSELPIGTTLLELAKEVIDPPAEYEPLIEEKIHSLSYSEFLQTLYWRVIAAFKRKQMGFKCEECGSTKDLNVHHRTYTIHGIEHNSGVIEKDLMLVCGECHRYIHNTSK